jgi:hypothetical protein
MNMKTSIYLGEDKVPVIVVCCGLTAIAIVAALNHTNTALPLIQWFGWEGFMGAAFAVLICLTMLRAQHWIQPVPTWLDQAINIFSVFTAIYISICMIVALALVNVIFIAAS